MERDRETHLWVSATACSDSERSLRNIREKRTGALQPVFSVTLAQYRYPYCFLLGSILSTISLLASPELCSQPLWWGSWQLQCMLLHGTEFRHLPGLGAQGKGGGCQVYPDPDTPEAVIAHCLAGPISSSARDLRVQIHQQKQSQIKLLVGMEKQPKTWP